MKKLQKIEKWKSDIFMVHPGAPSVAQKPEVWHYRSRQFSFISGLEEDYKAFLKSARHAQTRLALVDSKFL